MLVGVPMGCTGMWVGAYGVDKDVGRGAYGGGQGCG